MAGGRRRDLGASWRSASVTATTGTLTEKSEAGAGTLGPNAGQFAIEARAYSDPMIWIAAGPRMTTNSEGKMQKISGKSIFTGAFWACS